MTSRQIAYRIDQPRSAGDPLIVLLAVWGYAAIFGFLAVVTYAVAVDRYTSLEDSYLAKTLMVVGFSSAATLSCRPIVDAALSLANRKVD